MDHKLDYPKLLNGVIAIGIERDQIMLKRSLVIAALATGLSATAATEADAYIVRRIAPVRRVAARAVLPPYPVARRAAYRPVYRRPYYAAPAYYGPRVYVGVGFGW